MTGRILVVGSLNMDLVVTASRLPQTGETILGGRFATFPGGKGANQAVAAARMGARVSMIGRVGNDDFGQALRQVAARDGIDTKQIGIEPTEATGIALITVDSTGHNTIVVASGANLALTPDHIRTAKQTFSATDVLVAQLENPLEAIGEAVNLAAESGIHVVLNPAPAQPLSPDLLSKVEYLIPNEREAMQLVEADSPEAAAARLLDLGVRNVITTLGERGVVLQTRAGRTHFPAFPVSAIDTVAAGDAFVGAFAAGIASAMPVPAAIRLGSAAAAISVTRRGAQPSMPTRAEVDDFLRGHK